MAESFVPNEEHALLAFLDSLDQESKTAKLSWPEIKRWDRYAELARGERIYGGDEHPIFQADIISPAVARKTAMLTECEPILDISPRRPGLDNTAQVLKETVLGVWQGQSVQMGLESMRQHIGIAGSAGMRVIWSKQALDGLGDICLPVLDPRTVRFDPAVIKSYELDRAQYVGPIESVRPLSEMQRLFPKRAEQMQPSRITALVGRQAKAGFWAGLKGVLRTPAGISRGTGNQQSGRGENGAVPRVYVREYWVADPAEDEEGCLLYPGGRLFIRVGQDYDSIVANFDPNPDKDRTGNPYFDGLWDIEWLDNMPDADHPWGRSEIGALRFLQEAFNREGNLIVKSALRNGYPIWKVARGSLEPDQIRELKDLENLVVAYQMGRPVERIPAAVSEQTQLAMMQMILMLSDLILGTGDAGMKGQGRIEQRSGQQLEGLQQAAQVLVKAEARRLEAFLERVGKKIISRIFQFYPEERILTYFGGASDSARKYQFERKNLIADIQHLAAVTIARRARKDERGQPQIGAEELVAALLAAIKGAWRDFSFKIMPESSLAITKINRAMLKFQLAQAAFIPSKDVLYEVGYPNPEEKATEAAEEFQRRQMLGLPVPQPKGAAKGKK